MTTVLNDLCDKLIKKTPAYLWRYRSGRRRRSQAKLGTNQTGRRT